MYLFYFVLVVVATAVRLSVLQLAVPSYRDVLVYVVAVVLLVTPNFQNEQNVTSSNSQTLHGSL